MAESFQVESRAGEEGSASRQVARVYATALLDVAEEKDQSEAVADELKSLVDNVLRAAPEVNDALSSPIVRRTDKAPLINKAFKGNVSELLFNFLNVLNGKDRLNLIRQIHQEYESLLDKRAKRIRVKVRSATPLTAEQSERLRQSIGLAYGHEPVIATTIDESLLGGIVVQVGDEVFDGSVRTRIQNIRNQLLARSSYEIQVGRNRFSHPA